MKHRDELESNESSPIRRRFLSCDCKKKNTNAWYYITHEKELLGMMYPLNTTENWTLKCLKRLNNNQHEYIIDIIIQICLYLIIFVENLNSV
jgi:hypothetical protein